MNWNKFIINVSSVCQIYQFYLILNFGGFNIELTTIGLLDVTVSVDWEDFVPTFLSNITMPIEVPGLDTTGTKVIGSVCCPDRWSFIF